MQQLKQILSRLKRPSVVISLASQVISLFILLGFNINDDLAMAAVTIFCSILVTLGIMSNPDTQKKGYTDDLLTCSADGTKTPHVLVNGQLVCTDCGAAYEADTGQQA